MEFFIKTKKKYIFFCVDLHRRDPDNKYDQIVEEKS